MAIAHLNAETLRSVQIAHGGCLPMGLRTREFEMLRDVDPPDPLERPDALLAGLTR